AAHELGHVRPFDLQYVGDLALPDARIALDGDENRDLGDLDRARAQKREEPLERRQLGNAQDEARLLLEHTERDRILVGRLRDGFSLRQRSHQLPSAGVGGTIFSARFSTKARMRSIASGVDWVSDAIIVSKNSPS